jgi:arginine utilization protein RocB
MKVLKGTILQDGHFHNFRITIYAESKDAAAQIAEVLQRKIQQKGWMPNV